MTGLLVKLKLRLLRNGLRRSVWAVVGLVLGGLYGLGMVALALIGLIAMRWLEPALADEISIVAFTILTLAWIILPIFLYGSDNTVDPSRFALFNVRPGELIPGLWLGGLIGLPGLATLLLSLGLVGSWSIGVLPVIAALITAIVGALLCVLWSRALLTWLSALLRGRRFRDFAVVGLMVLIVGGSLGLQFAVRIDWTAEGQALQALHQASQVLGWTPFGWVWGIPGAVALGHGVEVLARILLTAALIVGLVLLWRIRLARELTSPLEAAGGGSKRKADSLVDRLVPATPAGAIAGRGLRYWRRDPRYQMSAVGLVMLPVFLIAVAWINDGAVQFAVWAPVLIALIGGSTIYADLAYDNSAFGLHLLSGVRGRDDRLGRVITYLWIEVPLTAVMIVATAAFSGEWHRVPAVIALVVIFLLGGLGAGTAVGAALPGTAAPPGANALAASSTGNLQSMLAFALSGTIMFAVSLPTLALVVGSLVGPIWLSWIALPVAVATGVAALLLGIRIGGARLDRRGPEVLAMVST